MAGDKTFKLMKTLVLRARTLVGSVDNKNFLVDERNRARLDVSQVGIENGKVSGQT